MLKQIVNTIHNFKRSPLLLFISIPGLMVALSASLLLWIFIKHETSYDTYFPNKNRVVRLYNTWIEENSVECLPLCLRDAYSEIPKQIPEIALATQFFRGGSNTIKYNNLQFKNNYVLFADDEVFNVFGLTLLRGNKNNALKQLNSIVITNLLAKKIFNTNDCIGKIITISNTEYTVTGVVNSLPSTTHFSFDVLASMVSINPEQMRSLEFFTYYLLRNNTDFDDVNIKISKLNNSMLIKQFGEYGATFKSGIEHLQQLHLHSITDFDLSPKGNFKQIFILSLIVLFILIIAVVNYVNLFVLYGEKRAQEIGIRKSFGATTFDIIKLIFFETFLLNSLAFLLVFLFISATFSVFAQHVQANLSWLDITNPASIAILIGFYVFMILITGSYPAFYLSKLNIIDVIKSGNKSINRKKWLSVASVIIQFSVSVFLITSVLIIYSQLRYLKRIPLGFNSKNIIGVSGFNNKICEKAQSVEIELAKLPFVNSIGASAHYMGGGCSGQLIYVYGNSAEKAKSINQYRVKPGFCSTMQLHLVAGSYFSSKADNKNSVILNSAAVKMLGLTNPVGKYIVLDVDPLKVIGVVSDFYYNEYAGEAIAPLVISMSNKINVFYIRIIGNFSKEEQQQISDVFTQFDGDYRFHFTTVDETYSRKFFNENMILKVLSYGALLAIFLSFSGMFALSVFNVEKRTKEIGIRKVLGSTSLQVITILIIDITKWVLWALPLPLIISFFIMKEWLNNFANKIDLSIIYFISGAIATVLIAVFAILLKSIHASRKNPIENLRYE